NNLTMRNSSFKFQRTADAREYATLNIKNLSGNGRFVINTDLSKGKGDFISVGHGTGNYHLVVADTGKEISGTAENLNLVLNKQGDAVFSLS
ncbi:autotransporter outer membrane beta-barrel domain-containing protein, partial [Escherichia coli]|nr:autotransporter outer membrane beta-barrel domain-containing protein [Escherichia coli]